MNAPRRRTLCHGALGFACGCSCPFIRARRPRKRRPSRRPRGPMHRARCTSSSACPMASRSRSGRKQEESRSPSAAMQPCRLSRQIQARREAAPRFVLAPRRSHSRDRGRFAYVQVVPEIAAIHGWGLGLTISEAWSVGLGIGVLRHDAHVRRRSGHRFRGRDARHDGRGNSRNGERNRHARSTRADRVIHREPRPATDGSAPRAIRVKNIIDRTEAASFVHSCISRNDLVDELHAARLSAHGRAKWKASVSGVRLHTSKSKVKHVEPCLFRRRPWVCITPASARTGRGGLLDQGDAASEQATAPVAMYLVATQPMSSGLQNTMPVLSCPPKSRKFPRRSTSRLVPKSRNARASKTRHETASLTPHSYESPACSPKRR